MTDLLRRFRGLAVAIVALAISAGAVFAAAPHVLQATNTGSVGAEEPTAGAGDDESEAPESEDPGDDQGTDTVDKAEAPEAPEAPEADTGSTDTHGALVSAAAAMETPAGFTNHGAFVSCVAHMKDATVATIDWTTVTPESCAAAGHGKSADAKAKVEAKRAEHAAAKTAREAARAAAKAARGAPGNPHP